MIPLSNRFSKEMTNLIAVVVSPRIVGLSPQENPADTLVWWTIQTNLYLFRERAKCLHASRLLAAGVCC